MKGYSISGIAEITDGKVIQLIKDDPLNNLLIDSRKIINPSSSVFFALKGQHRNGHQFIKDLYFKNVRNFVISEPMETSMFPEANFIQVKDSLAALQMLAAHHRSAFTIPVIGITGSNGKTIVKEWLDQLLQDRYKIVKSPKSYNSQIGVPLSVWQVNEEHELAIFEAGISTVDEMDALEKIIQPTIAVFTNIGEAHNEGFESLAQKVTEKAKLFKNAGKLVFCLDYPEVNQAMIHLQETENSSSQIFSWSRNQKDAVLYVESIEVKSHTTNIVAVFANKNTAIEIPFRDKASIENAINCWLVLLVMGVEESVISQKMTELQPVDMRLELKKGINHSLIINDSYSADINSLEIALDFLQQQKASNFKSVILSDFLQSGLEEEKLYQQIASTLIHHKVNKVIGIGEGISQFLHPYLSEVNIQQHYFPTTDKFIQHFLFSDFKNDVILIKGARKFKFEKIVSLLEEKAHQTLLEINLNALTHNLKEYRRNLQPGVKVMAMVKAFAYGSGGAEIAGNLEFNKVDYLAVAYTDEAVELRKAGISLPIMVMNPDENSFNAIVEHALEPNIFSLSLLMQFNDFVIKQGLDSFSIHLEMETGMNRLGFEKDEIEDLIKILNEDSGLVCQSVFTHLAASESESLDDFTNQQFDLFTKICNKLEEGLNKSFIRHIANSAAIIRHPCMQLDMVRLGIGLYGVENDQTGKLKLETVAELRSTIAQIKKINKGESVSYNRKSIVKRDSIIATVRIGYADGFPRSLGNGKGKMWVNGKFAPVIGSVCMDMTMLDVTDIQDVKEADGVIVFGKVLPVQQLASWADTIPYEIMTGISQRVKRIYFEE
jgi:Alr-MurF fusion protein